MSLLTFTIIVFIVLTLSLGAAAFMSLLADRIETVRNRKLDALLDHTRRRSFNIIHGAMRQAHEMLVDAELTGIKRVVEGKANTSQIEKRYERDLANLLSYATGEFIKSTEQLQREYKQFLVAMEAEIRKQIEANRTVLDETFHHTASSVETSLTDFLDSQKQRVGKTVDEELKKTEELILAYRNGRIAVVNEQLFELVSKVTEEVLGKKLSLDDHAEFVEKALENARADGFFNEKVSSAKNQ